MITRTLKCLPLAVPLAIGTVACGGSDGNTTAPPSVVSDNDPANTAKPASDGEESGSNADVEAYCKQVDEFVAANKKVLADPASADVAAITKQGTDLAATTAKLAASATGDDAARIQECSAKFAEIGD